MKGCYAEQTYPCWATSLDIQMFSSANIPVRSTGREEKEAIVMNFLMAREAEKLRERFSVSEGVSLIYKINERGRDKMKKNAYFDLKKSRPSILNVGSL